MAWCIVKDRICLHGTVLSQAQEQLYLYFTWLTFIMQDQIMLKQRCVFPKDEAPPHYYKVVRTFIRRQIIGEYGSHTE